MPGAFKVFVTCAEALQRVLLTWVASTRAVISFLLAEYRQWLSCTDSRKVMQICMRTSSDRG